MDAINTFVSVTFTKGEVPFEIIAKAENIDESDIVVDDTIELILPVTVGVLIGTGKIVNPMS